MTSPPDAETKEAIVLAAFECTVRLGIDGLRLRHVAAEAGMDETTLRQHFPTQRDLVSALIEDITLQFAATTRTTEGTPAERLRAHLEALSRTVRDRPALFLVLAELEVRARRDPLVRSAVERDEQGCRAWLAELFREGAGQGVWAEGVDPESAVELVLTVFKGIRVAPGGADAALMQLEHVLTRA